MNESLSRLVESTSFRSAMDPFKSLALDSTSAVPLEQNVANDRLISPLNCSMAPDTGSYRKKFCRESTNRTWTTFPRTPRRYPRLPDPVKRHASALGYNDDLSSTHAPFMSSTCLSCSAGRRYRRKR